MAFTLSNNEWLATLTNLCLQVVTFDNVQFRSPFSVFERKYTEFGDKIACVNAFAPNGENWNPETNPYATVDSNSGNVRTPSVYEKTLTTVLKRRYPLVLNEEIAKGAFEDMTALGLWVATLKSQLLALSDIDIYEVIAGTYASHTLISYSVAQQLFNSSSITGHTGIDNSVSALPTTDTGWKDFYAEILKTANSMSLPSIKYSASTDMNDTHKRAAMGVRKYLIVTPEVQAKLDTYIKASLLNSDKIAEKKVFDEVIVAEPEIQTATSTFKKVYAMVVTEDVYRYSPRIREMLAMPRNAADLSIPYYYHVWTNMGATNSGQGAIWREA